MGGREEKGGGGHTQEVNVQASQPNNLAILDVVRDVPRNDVVPVLATYLFHPHLALDDVNIVNIVIACVTAGALDGELVVLVRPAVQDEHGAAGVLLPGEDLGRGVDEGVARADGVVADVDLGVAAVEDERGVAAVAAELGDLDVAAGCGVDG